MKSNAFPHAVPTRTLASVAVPEPALRQLQAFCREAKKPGVPRAKKLLWLISGRGKSQALLVAEAVASELKLNLYRIDVSKIVSKYIGETEKNVDAIFGRTKASNVILFFDEADALFGKRTSVKDSHDRYANLELDYLLQRLEANLHLAILATTHPPVHHRLLGSVLHV